MILTVPSNVFIVLLVQKQSNETASRCPSTVKAKGPMSFGTRQRSSEHWLPLFTPDSAQYRLNYLHRTALRLVFIGEVREKGNRRLFLLVASALGSHAFNCVIFAGFWCSQNVKLQRRGIQQNTPFRDRKIERYLGRKQCPLPRFLSQQGVPSPHFIPGCIAIGL